MDNPDTASFPSVRVASNTKCHLGENPLWHPIHRKLYWCDILLARLYCYDPETHITELLRDQDTALGGAFLGGFTIQQDGALLLFMAAGRIDRWTGSILRDITDRIQTSAEPSRGRQDWQR